MAYQTMTAAQLRSTIRSITDLDADDVSDALLDLYIRDGYYRILDAEKRWPWLEFTFSFNTRVGVRSYTLADITSEPVSQIVSIVDSRDTGERLDMVGYDEAERIYIGAYDVPNDPLYYAVWAGQVHLYPKPNAVVELVARGYREPFDWQTENGDVDAAPSLHFPLVYYAVSRVYQQLEDPTMANVYKQAFDEGVSLAISNIQTPTSHHALVLSGRKTGRRTMRGWVESLGRSQPWS